MSGPHYGNGVGNIQGTRQAPSVNVVPNAGYTYTAQPSLQDWNQQPGVQTQQPQQSVQTYDATGGHPQYMVGTDWRSQLTKEDRNRIVYKIIEVLSQCVVVDPNQPTSKTDPQLIAMAHKYEENVLNTVTNKNEYFEKIAAKLYDLKTKNTKNKVPPPSSTGAKATMAQMPPQNVAQPPQAHLKAQQRHMEMAQQHPHIGAASFPGQAQPGQQQQMAGQPAQPQQMQLPQLAPQPPQIAQQLSQAQQIAQMSQPHAATAKAAKGRQLATKAVQQQPPPQPVPELKPELLDGQSGSKPNIMMGLTKAAAKQESKHILQQQLHQLQPVVSMQPLSSNPLLQQQQTPVPSQTASQQAQAAQAQAQAQAQAAQAQIQVQAPAQAVQVQAQAQAQAQAAQAAQAQAQAQAQAAQVAQAQAQAQPQAAQAAQQSQATQMAPSVPIPQGQAPGTHSIAQPPQPQQRKFIEKVQCWPYADLASSIQVIANVLAKITNGPHQNTNLAMLKASSETVTPKQPAGAPSTAASASTATVQEQAATFWWVSGSSSNDAPTRKRKCQQSLESHIISEESSTCYYPDAKQAKTTDLSASIVALTTEDQIDTCIQSNEFNIRNSCDDAIVLEDVDKGLIFFRKAPVPFLTTVRSPPAEPVVEFMVNLSSIETVVSKYAKHTQHYSIIDQYKEFANHVLKVDAEIKSLQERFSIVLVEQLPNNSIKLRCCLLDYEGQVPPIFVTLPSQYPNARAKFEFGKFAAKSNTLSNMMILFEKKLGTSSSLPLTELLNKYKSTFLGKDPKAIHL